MWNSPGAKKSGKLNFTYLEKTNQENLEDEKIVENMAGKITLSGKNNPKLGMDRQRSHYVAPHPGVCETAHVNVSPDGHQGAVELSALPVGEQLRDGPLLPARFEHGRTACHLLGKEFIRRGCRR